MTDRQPPEKEAYDDLEMWRCRQLGGPVTFKYCRIMNDGLPCQRLPGCWGAQINLIEYLEANFTAGEMEQVFGTEPKTRLGRIIETLNRVREERQE